MHSGWMCQPRSTSFRALIVIFGSCTVGRQASSGALLILGLRAAKRRKEPLSMRVHLVNPSDTAFGIGVITPRWLYVLAAATPASHGDPVITDETLEQIQPELIHRGDIVGIGIHTGNALRGMEVGRMARERGAWVVYGGIHATLYPEEAFEHGGAHAVVKGDGDVVWAKVIADLEHGTAQAIYEGGRVAGEQFLPARWDLAPRNRY